jgi:hypothetical protein
MSKIKKCPFCQKSPPEIFFTGEHVLRDKFNTLFEGLPTSVEWTNKARSNDGSDISTIKIIPQGPFSIEVNSICNICNNGWMNYLEDEVEDLLVQMFLGNFKPISQYKKSRLGFWASKTAVVEGLKFRNGIGGVPPHHYQAMWSKKSVPPNTHVWLGRAEKHPSAYIRFRRLAKKSDNGSSQNFYIATLWIMKMVFFVVGIDNDNLEDFLLDEISEIDNIGIMKMWPSISQDTGIFPNRTLSREEIENVWSWADFDKGFYI